MSTPSTLRASSGASSGAELVSRSPQQPSDVIVTMATTDAGQVQHIADRARRAGRAWAATNVAARATALRRCADAVAAAATEFEDLVIREVGKPKLEARGEVSRAVSILHYYAQQVFDPVGAMYPPSLQGLLYTERRARGVAGLITPWNFPIAIPLWKAAPALAAGNAVLLKPSSEALGCALRLAEVFDGILPADLFNVVPGEGEIGRAVIDAADVVSFTGSFAVGREVAVAATRSGIPVQAEMGGQNAAIVLADADVERTAAMLAAAAMGYAGQKCTATRRVIVVGDQSRFVDAFAAAVESLPELDPSDDRALVGPVITEKARQAVLDAVAQTAAEGGRVVTGGAAGRSDGWFMRPAVVTGLAPTSRLVQEEIFGPFAAVLSVSTAQEAVEVANSVRYGLVTSVHGQDLSALLPVVGGLDSGLIKVNAPTTGVDFYLPFGGEKQSSSGPREQGKAAMDFYTSTRTVTIGP